VEPDGTAWRVPALPVEVVDTTGAGDAFTGGFAAAVAKGDTLPDALKLASAAAGLACTGFGAQSGLIADTDMSGILSAIAIQAH
jgi:ribokinase